jgi:purine-nucleoside/S-methyl-5'-thioadenosine phosphorylase / adenosine deaminase
VSAPPLIEFELPGARAAFSTRRGGVSEGPYESLNLGILTDDEPARVLENRHRLAAAAGLAPERVAMGWQVHGADLQRWEGAPDGPGFAKPGGPLPAVDAHVTSATEVGLIVLVADCLPVALASEAAVAMIHCGWRGLAGGIVERTLEALGDRPAAVVGPGIGPCCYEVGPEVLEAFDGLDGVAHGRMLDLRAIVRSKLEAAGAEPILDVDLCTSCRADLFFSHRRDGGVTGRQGGMVSRT